MSDVCHEMMADKTTTDAVLLAINSAVARMYLNGTTEVIVGDTSAQGCALVFILTADITCLIKCELCTNNRLNWFSLRDLNMFSII